MHVVLQVTMVIKEAWELHTKPLLHLKACMSCLMCPWFLSDFNPNWNVINLAKLPSTKFHGNPFSHYMWTGRKDKDDGHIFGTFSCKCTWNRSYTAVDLWVPQRMRNVLTRYQILIKKGWTAWRWWVSTWHFDYYCYLIRSETLG